MQYPPHRFRQASSQTCLAPADDHGSELLIDHVALPTVNLDIAGGGHDATDVVRRHEIRKRNGTGDRREKGRWS
jgi:hypothetical protein